MIVSTIPQLYARLAREGGMTPTIVGTVLALKAGATIFEGAGVAMLVPIFEAASKDGTAGAGEETTKIWTLVENVLTRLGLPMTFEVLLAVVAVLILMRQLTTYAHRVYLVAAQQRMIATLRNRTIEASFTAAVSYHDETPTGHIVNDIVTETQRAVAVGYAVISALGNFIVTAIYMVGITLAVGWLTLTVIVAAAVLGVGLRGLMRLTRDNSEVLASANRGLSKLTFDRLRAVRLLKLAGAEGTESAKVAETVEEARGAALLLAKLQARIPLFVEPVGAVILILLFYVGVRVLNLPFEIMIVVVLILARLIPVIQEMAKGVQVFLAGYGSLKFIVERIESSTVAAENMQADGSSEPFRLSSAIAFDNVRYRYPESAGRAAIDGVSFSLPAGRMTAIVGPSGAGKSTLIDLLPALRTLGDGEICIDDRPISEFSPTELRKSIAFVPQFPLLLAGPIDAHIRYGRPEASEQEIIEAATIAGAHDFISNLVDGYRSAIGEEGIGLSGGQRQRLDLARAILEKKPLLILDEPASNLDAESEEAFRIALQRLRDKTDITILMIAHQLASVVDADQIIVLRDGRVEATGTHRELMAARGWYARAFAAGHVDAPPALMAQS